MQTGVKPATLRLYDHSVENQANLQLMWCLGEKKRYLDNNLNLYQLPDWCKMCETDTSCLFRAHALFNPHTALRSDGSFIASAPAHNGFCTLPLSNLDWEYSGQYGICHGVKREMDPEIQTNTKKLSKTSKCNYRINKRKQKEGRCEWEEQDYTKL